MEIHLPCIDRLGHLSRSTVKRADDPINSSPAADTGRGVK